MLAYDNTTHYFRHSLRAIIAYIDDKVPVVLASVPAAAHSSRRWPAAFAMANILEEDQVSWGSEDEISPLQKYLWYIFPLTRRVTMRQRFTPLVMKLGSVVVSTDTLDSDASGWNPAGTESYCTGQLHSRLKELGNFFWQYLSSKYGSE